MSRTQAALTPADFSACGGSNPEQSRDTSGHPRVDALHGAANDLGEHDRAGVGDALAAGEEPDFATDDESPVILPVSAPGAENWITKQPSTRTARRRRHSRQTRARSYGSSANHQGMTVRIGGGPAFQLA